MALRIKIMDNVHSSKEFSIWFLNQFIFWARSLIYRLLCRDRVQPEPALVQITALPFSVDCPEVGGGGAAMCALPVLGLEIGTQKHVTHWPRVQTSNW